VQQDICNGCGYCVPACPFGVVDLNPLDGKAHKCTLCYDRLKGGLEPACAKACPTNSIQFGPVEELQARAMRRVEDLHERGVNEAYLYGTPGSPGATGGRITTRHPGEGRGPGQEGNSARAHARATRSGSTGRASAVSHPRARTLGGASTVSHPRRVRPRAFRVGVAAKRERVRIRAAAREPLRSRSGTCS